MEQKEIFNRLVEEIIKKEELENVLKSKKKLRIYFGVDPSSPEIHLGHSIGLRLLSFFQQMGHKIIFLVGDFTGMIGDPTGRETSRKPLSKEEVLENAKTYKKQVEKFLDFSGKNPAEIAFNSKWNEKFTFRKIIKLASLFTVQQFIERDMFQQRLKKKKPIALHEFLYPLIQGYDAVMLNADIQVGGSDQKFNMLISRQMVKQFLKKPQIVITVPLLEGTDGRKMSKSFYNIVEVEEKPQEMFGKIMSLKDEFIIKYFILCSELEIKEIRRIEKKLKRGENPKEAKLRLAFEITKMYHGKKEAQKALKEFERVFAQKKTPEKIPELKFPKKSVKIINLLYKLNLVKSKSEAKRLITQKGVLINGKIIEEVQKIITPKNGMIIKVGKRKWIKII